MRSRVRANDRRRSFSRGQEELRTHLGVLIKIYKEKCERNCVVILNHKAGKCYGNR